MNANELRIGNLVNQDSEKFKTGKVLSINSKSILLENQYRTQRALIKKIKPIPLTEDWLFKFGFPKEDLIITEHQMHFTLGNIKIWRPFDKFLLDTYRIEIIHVHQLQNLYFALTNTELIWIGEK